MHREFWWGNIFTSSHLGENVNGNAKGIFGQFSDTQTVLE